MIMLRRHLTATLSALAFIIAFIFIGQSAQADWNWDIGFRYNWPGRSYSSYRYDNKIGTERRQGYQADDFVERGQASITESPLFDDGIRLAAWATRHEEDYEHGMASAIYYFDLPSSAHSVKIKVSYDGEADEKDSKEAIAGRVWIKRARIGEDYEKYYPKDEKYEGVDKPLYGDTFVLRARKHSETIQVSVDDYRINGVMELHVVAEGKQRIDIKYIELEAYTSYYEPRVVTRYYSDYAWRPWYDYTYSYFYVGPYYHYGDGFYLRYTYPRYSHYYSSIRRRHSSYLYGYYSRHPRSRYVRRSYSRGTRRVWSRDRLNRWTRDHADARRSYRGTSGRSRGPVAVQKSRSQIRRALGSRSGRSPTVTPSLSGRPGIGSSRSRTGSYRSAPAQTRGSTGLSIRRRSSSSIQSGRGRSMRQAPSRSSSRSMRSSPSRSRSRGTGRSFSSGRSRGGMRSGRSSGGSRGSSRGGRGGRR